MTPGAAYQKAYRRRHPERARARYAVRWAVRSGSLVRGLCHCGAPGTDAHHPRGYDNGHALDVEWLCATHHRAVHAPSAEQVAERRDRKLAYMRAYQAAKWKGPDMTPEPVRGTVRQRVGLDLVGWDELTAAAYVTGYAVAIAIGAAVVGWLLA